MICKKCNEPVRLDDKFNIDGDHVDCDNPSYGAKEVTGEKTVSPDGVTWKMEKHLA